jgi:hypothetical protein
MQLTVERDVQDHSNYVIPKRVGKTFDDAALCEIVRHGDTISHARDCLSVLVLVNFNVEVR